MESHRELYTGVWGEEGRETSLLFELIYGNVWMEIGSSGHVEFEIYNKYSRGIWS